MDLHSGLPYWIAKNPMYNYFNPLLEDFTTDVLIIGSGITGSLVAHELCTSGIKCAVIDKRSVSTGSSIASTALLQYEIDTPLSKLAEMIGEQKAVNAYRACLNSIGDLQSVFQSIAYNPDFEWVPSIFYASDRKGSKLIEKEHEIRLKYNFPAELLDKDELYNQYKFKAPNALVNHVSAQVDTYSAATHLLDYHKRLHDLKLFTHTRVESCNSVDNHYETMTENGKKITSKAVIIAAGFEAGQFLPEDVMQLTSTYAIISQPVEPQFMWPGHSLIWETAEPYLYIRTEGNSRIIVGGEDEPFRNPEKRDKLLRDKIETLEKKIKKLFPELPFVTDMAWCGTFSSTHDGLPFIGNWPGNDNMYYALGYGGNGITFSMIAAQMIRNKLNGFPDEREEIFGFGRLRLNS